MNPNGDETAQTQGPFHGARARLGQREMSLTSSTSGTRARNPAAIGGLVTLIASMASLISYKQVVAEGAGTAGAYLLRFTVVNVAFLATLVGLAVALG